jgi:trans-aconitate methyltransferase
VAEWRLYEEGTIPEWTTQEWYAGRDRAPHLEETPHIPRLEKAAEYVCLAADMGAKTFVDLGAGDGGLLSLVRSKRPQLHAYGYDAQQTNVDGAAEREVDVMLRDVLNPEAVLWGDVCAGTEFLEHLLDPHGFLCGLPSSVEWFVASSPAWETDKSHYAFHTWAWDMDGYAALFHGAGFTVLRHEMAGEFQVLLAAAP